MNFRYEILSIIVQSSTFFLSGTKILIKFIFVHFKDIRAFNATQTYNKTCLSSVIQTSELIGLNEVKPCTLEQNISEYEEEIPYITGNTLWAIYQFTVLIVLLSILRARMVNTYHRIFKEADVQWKFFRCVFCDHNSTNTNF